MKPSSLSYPFQQHIKKPLRSFMLDYKWSRCTVVLFVRLSSIESDGFARIVYGLFFFIFRECHRENIPACFYESLGSLIPTFWLPLVKANTYLTNTTLHACKIFIRQGDKYFWNLRRYGVTITRVKRKNNRYSDVQTHRFL